MPEPRDQRRQRRRKDFDVLLTAMAVGEELGDEQQAALDRLLSENADARRALHDTAAAAAVLRVALHAEPDVPAGQSHPNPKEPAMADHTNDANDAHDARPHPAWPALLAMAAALVVALGLTWLIARPDAGRELARADDGRELARADADSESPGVGDFGAFGGTESEETAAGEPRSFIDPSELTDARSRQPVREPAAAPAEPQTPQTPAADAELAERQRGQVMRSERPALPAEVAPPADAIREQKPTRQAAVPAAAATASEPAPAEFGTTTVDLGVGGRGGGVGGGGGFGGGGGGQAFFRQAPAAVPAQAAVPARAAGDFGDRAVFPGDAPRPLNDELDDRGDFSREAYDRIVDNPFVAVADEPLSTFGVDVDTASYANVRRFLTDGQLPPPDAVRVEELINYFPYDYAGPAAGAEAPFATHLAVADAPWNPRHQLVRVALKGREIDDATRPPANLVFLLDVSGSMDQPNKLPLVKSAMKTLLEQLRGDDRVAIVVYAGASGLVLDSTPADRAADIAAALERLSAGGGTNGGQGIELAYKTAEANFIKGGVNRVILATDGDFNLGTTDRGGLTRLIEDKAKTGVYLTVLGFGTGNVQDATMEELSNKGEGNYAYVDSEREAEKVLAEQAGGTLVAIAKDVKLQVEFNPALVSAYRLIGYENRVLATQDFADDTKDAGDLGSGHTVTAFYELVPATLDRAALEQEAKQLQLKLDQLADARAAGLPPADADRQETALRQQLDLARAALDAAPEPTALKYQRPAALAAAAEDGELLTVNLRYKHPDAPKEQGTSKLLSVPLAADAATSFAEADADFRFAAAVAGWGMVLRDSPYAAAASTDWAVETAQAALADDPGGYRAEAINLMKDTAALRPQDPAADAGHGF